MRVLVATKETQGKRSSDFSWCTEGEIVHFAMECDDTGIDGPCGCQRAMGGIDTHTATTTMKVVDMQITKEEFFARLKKSLHDAGWTMITDDEIQEEVKELLELAAGFPLGSIVEKRGSSLQTR